MAISLAQIAGGAQLKSDIELLKKSYEAAKVITTIEKTAADGETPAVMYNVDELLNQINEALNGGEGGVGSFESVKQQLKDISEKKVKDTVRMQYTAVYDSGTDTYSIDTTGIDAAVPGIDKTVALPVYTLDNKAMYDTEGNQLKFSFNTGNFVGVPAKFDLSTSKTNSKDKTSVEENELAFEALKNIFQFKVFPVGTFDLGSIPEAALLDNEEVDLLAYDKIINKIIVELAKDDDVVAAIVSKVGENTVAEQVTAITDALAARILALESGKFDKANVIADVTTTDEETGESSTTEGTIAAVADASNEKVVSEKVLSRELKSIRDSITNAGTTADTTYVAKADVIRTDDETEGAVTAIRVVAESSDDKVASEKAIATMKAALAADIATAQSAAEAAQATADAAIPKTDIVTEIHPVALGEGESGDIASDEKVASEKAIVEALDALEEAFDEDLTDEINARATEDAAINSKITAHTSQIEALNNITKIEDVVAVGSSEAVTTFNLSQVPNGEKVTMYVNGVAYFENEDFTVNRETKVATWINTDFDITSEVASKVRFVYRTGNKVTNVNTGVKILHQDFLPTNGTFNVGDMVFRLTMTQGNNIGWVCTETGTPGTWTEFGVVDFGETIKVVEEDE